VRRRRRPAGVTDERRRLLWDSYYQMTLVSYCSPRGERDLPERWQRIADAVEEALAPADFEALTAIVDGRVHASGQAAMVKLAGGPEPGGDEDPPPGYRSIARRAGWGEQPESAVRLISPAKQNGPEQDGRHRPEPPPATLGPRSADEFRSRRL
jgi:hypothetical protein